MSQICRHWKYLPAMVVLLALTAISLIVGWRRLAVADLLQLAAFTYLALEALFGAVYLDGGYEAVYDLVTRLIVTTLPRAH